MSEGMKTSEKIALFVEANPFATYRQIMTAVGVRSTSVVDHHLKRMKLSTGKEQLDHLLAENKELRQRIGLLVATEYERDEADRRAGAAERELANLKEELLTYKDLRSQRKRAAGYDDDTSFDVVWADALAALKEKQEDHHDETQV
jgi:uncharacterized small protein (DUF1192 family)